MLSGWLIHSHKLNENDEISFAAETRHEYDQAFASNHEKALVRMMQFDVFIRHEQEEQTNFCHVFLFEQIASGMKQAS